MRQIKENVISGDFGLITLDVTAVIMIMLQMFKKEKINCFPGVEDINKCKVIVKILLIILIMILTTGCFSVSEKTVKGSTYILEDGILKIMLDEDPSTGCVWHYTMDKSGIVDCIDQSQGNGFHQWVIKGVSKGRVEITFKRSDDNEMKYIVQVDQRGKITEVQCMKVTYEKISNDN